MVSISQNVDKQFHFIQLEKWVIRIYEIFLLEIASLPTDDRTSTHADVN